MAKRFVEQSPELTEIEVPLPPEEPKISFEKYLQLHRSDLHIYSAAYLKALHIGKMKTRGEWELEMTKEGLKE